VRQASLNLQVQPWQQALEILQGLLLPGELMAALHHHLSGSGLTGVEDKFRQRIDPGTGSV
jgi:hypothetical protein